jgi:glycosyltransferase involved in cell wall biosynthesis
MPRILHCIDTTGPGGAETMFVGLASSFNVAPFASVAVIRGPGWVRDQLDRNRVPVVELNSKGSLNVGFLRGLVRLIRDLEIDLVHAHLLGSNVYGTMAARLTGVPVIATFHGSVDISPGERMASLKFGIIRRWSTIVAVSAGLRSEIASRLRVDEAAIRLIPNGIDCHRFATASPLGIRKSIGFDPKALLIGSLGNFRPAKAYPTGLHGLRLLRDRGVDAHWVIAGHQRPNDPLVHEFEALVDGLELRPYVHVLGFVDQAESFLADIDCFLLCSESEGHPLALTQAMASGKAIVATRCGIERLLDETEPCAWLVPVNAPADLASAMQDALSDASERCRRSRRAKAIANSRFDNAVVFEKYEALYRELLVRSRAS